MFTERSPQAGLSLVELIVFIVVVSVGVAGLITVINSLVRNTADPLQTKQMTAVAESMLSEVLSKPFTWCDPDDDLASTATSYAGCTTAQNTLGPSPNTETRNGGPGQVFDNVADYAGFAMDNISDAAGGNVVNGYRAEVAIVQAGATFGLAADAVLEVTATACLVTAPSSPCAGRNSVALTGYRFRYAPRP